MKIKGMKKFVALLLSVLLIATMIPISVLAGDSGNTAPAVEDFATADELRANFDMNNSTVDKTFKKVYFGKNKTWSIVGVDPVGGGLVLLSQNYLYGYPFSSSTAVKDYDPAWGITYEGGFVPEKVASNHYGASDMRAAFQSYAESGNSACFFTDAQLDMIIPTTIYTADVYNKDAGSPRIYSSVDKLYPAYANGINDTYITVGSNSIDNLETDLKLSISFDDNVIDGFTRSAYTSNNTVLTNGNIVASAVVNDTRRQYVPVFQLDTSNVLFGSIYEGVTAEGEPNFYTDKTFTLRMDAEKYDVDLGEA